MKKKKAREAQLVEQSSEDAEVASSSLVLGKKTNILIPIYNFFC